MGITIGAAKKEVKLRIGVFGRESAGKSHFGLSGPSDVCAYDVEGRIGAMNFVPEFEKKFNGEIPIVQFDERTVAEDFVEACRGMRSGRFKGPNGNPFQTFLIDSWTIIEKLYQEQAGIDTISDDRTRIKNLGDVRKKIENEILNPALAGPTKCHIVVTAHEANAWGLNGQGKQAVTGARPDATRNFQHYFDLVFHMQRENSKQPGGQPKRTATVVKSNYQSILPIGMVIENLTWEHPALKAIIGNEIQIVPVPATELKQLFAKAKAEANLPEETIGAWFGTNGIALVNGAISPEDSHRAKGLLETILDESAESARGLAS